MSADQPPLCECGCGEPVRDRRNGVWARWRPGHHRRSGGAVDAAPAPARSGPRRHPIHYGDPAWLIDGEQLTFDDLL